MRGRPADWVPTQEEAQKMLELRADGMPYRGIAEAVGHHPTVVENWLLRNAGRMIGIRNSAYHGRDAVHRRMGIYFDVSKMGENDATD